MLFTCFERFHLVQLTAVRFIQNVYKWKYSCLRKILQNERERAYSIRFERTQYTHLRFTHAAPKQASHLPPHESLILCALLRHKIFIFHRRILLLRLTGKQTKATFGSQFSFCFATYLSTATQLASYPI